MQSIGRASATRRNTAYQLPLCTELVKHGFSLPLQKLLHLIGPSRSHLSNLPENQARQSPPVTAFCSSMDAELWFCTAHLLKWACLETCCSLWSSLLITSGLRGWPRPLGSTGPAAAGTLLTHRHTREGVKIKKRGMETFWKNEKGHVWTYRSGLPGAGEEPSLPLGWGFTIWSSAAW